MRSVTQVEYAIPGENPALMAVSTPDSARALRVLWYRKWHIFACAFFLGMAAFVMAARQPEQFTAEATLLLDPRKSNLALGSDPVVSDLEFTNATIESEVTRIASVAAIREVVGALGKNRFSELDPGPRERWGLIGLVDKVKGMIAPRHPDPFVPILDEERVFNRVVQRIAKGSQALRQGDSFVIKLRVTTGHPVLSADIANALTHQYLDQQIAERKAIAAQATRWHATQLAERQEALAAAERRVDALRRTQLGDTGSTSEVMALQLSELARVLAEARAEVSAAKARQASLLRDIEQRGARLVAETQQDDSFQRLLQREDTLLLEAQRLASEFGENHKDRQAIAIELRRVQARIVSAVKALADARSTEVLAAQARVEALRHDVETLQARMVDDVEKTGKLRQHEIEVRAAKESYEILVSRMADIQAQADLQLPDARVLNVATIPTGPSAPRPKFMGFIGASVGASIGLFSVLILEAFGRGVASREDLQQLTGAANIYVLPSDRMERPEHILSRLADRSCPPIAERLRQLHMPCGQAKGLVLMTSSLPQEGRSTIAIALAQMSAEAGQRTLLLHLGSGREMGRLSDEANARNIAGGVMEGAVPRTYQDAEFACLELPSLKSIQGGGPLQDQLEQWREQFDVIYIDGPALLAHSDALQLARLVDRTLYVVAFLSTPKRAISSALALLNTLDVTPAALILNKSDTRLDPDMHVPKR